MEVTDRLEAFCRLIERRAPGEGDCVMLDAGDADKLATDIRSLLAMRALEPRASSDGGDVERRLYQFRTLLSSNPNAEGSEFVEAFDGLSKHILAALQSQPSSNEARLRETLEIVAGGDVDVSDTAIIVGNGASTVMRQIHAALSERRERVMGKLEHRPSDATVRMCRILGAKWVWHNRLRAALATPEEKK